MPFSKTYAELILSLPSELQGYSVQYGKVVVPFYEITMRINKSV
jgi:hypothetical protein